MSGIIAAYYIPIRGYYIPIHGLPARKPHKGVWLESEQQVYTEKLGHQLDSSG